MSQTEFEQKCCQHDWFYQHQDCFQSGNFSRGEQERQELLKAIQIKPELQEVYNKYNPFN